MMTKIRVTLVIQNCPVNCFEHNLEQTLKAVCSASRAHPDFIIFPEMNLTGYSSSNVSNAAFVEPSWTDNLSKLSLKYNTAILVGLVEKTASGRTYVTHLIFRPGQIVGRYRKIHLSPFEAPYFTPGDDIGIFKFKGIHLGIQLCYDAHFPELATAMALKQADIIFIPHASPRGNSEEKSASWMRHLTARAFDNTVFIAAVNQAGDNGAGLNFPGISMMIGPDGFVADQEDPGNDLIQNYELDMDHLKRIRTSRMGYFLPNRRHGLIQK